MIDTVESAPINEVREHIILEPFTNQEEEFSIEDPNDINNFPKIEHLYKYYNQKIDDIHDILNGNYSKKIIKNLQKSIFIMIFINLLKSQK